MHRLFFLLVVVGLAFAAPVQQSRPDASHVKETDTHLLEIGHHPNLRFEGKAPDEIKLVSYNIRWRGGDDLQKLAAHLQQSSESGGATILGLQEVDRNRKRTGNKNTAKILAENLGMHYAWAAPPTPKSEKEEETGVMLLTSYDLSDVHRIVLPHEGPNGRRRAAIGATIKVGPTDVRIYSVHSETRLSMSKKLDQMKAVLSDLAGYPKTMPAIVLGDFNTWEPGAGDKNSKLFKSEGFHTPFDSSPTFSRRILFVPLRLKLDWIWLRNLEVKASGIDKKISLSDHWPLWVVFKLKKPEPPS